MLAIHLFVRHAKDAKTLVIDVVEVVIVQLECLLRVFLYSLHQLHCVLLKVS